MNKQNDSSIKIGLGVWVCFCVLIALWVFTKFLKGRQQLYSNLNVVEDSLRRMQEKIEADQRKKSMGFVDNIDDITACLTKTFNENQTQEDETSEAEDQKLLTTENEINKLNPETPAEEVVVEDKKNI